MRDLLLRQGDVLRQYAVLPPGEADVAVELPTGGGKTLVGLLIAEWRRRALGNRVAYLCPTIQLVNQVASKAHDYGLDVVTLVGRQANWDAAEFNRFQRGQAIAIAGYYQIFNSNPRLDSAQTLVLDDAHAAEDAVASNWSIDAVRTHCCTGRYGRRSASFSRTQPAAGWSAKTPTGATVMTSRSCHPRLCKTRRPRSTKRWPSTPPSETTPTGTRRR